MKEKKYTYVVLLLVGLWTHLDSVVVFNGLGDSKVSLQCQYNGHEDGGEDGDGLQLVAEVGEHVGVPVAKWSHILTNAWKKLDESE